MAPLWVYKLEPRGRFHFGRRGVGVEGSEPTSSSDLLFGALCSAVLGMNGLGGDYGLEALLTACQDGDPPFLISSLFPYAHDTLFLPRPKRDSSGPDMKKNKSWKRAKYLSRRAFEQLYVQEPLEPDSAVTGQGELRLALAQGLMMLAQEKTAFSSDANFIDPDQENEIRFWQTSSAPRVTVDRITNRSAVYQIGSVAFAKGAGLYFLAYWRDERWRKEIETALRFLGDEGLGGERSVGYGQFTPQEAYALELPEPPAAQAQRMTISLYYPKRTSEHERKLLAAGFYDLEISRGWVGAPGALSARRADVRLVSEGALLPAGGPDLLGDMADVKPGSWPPTARQVDRLLRYGYALTINVRMEANNAAD